MKTIQFVVILVLFGSLVLSPICYLFSTRVSKTSCASKIFKILAWFFVLAFCVSAVVLSTSDLGDSIAKFFADATLSLLL